MLNNQITLNKNKISTIIFDLDGVILDSVHLKTDAFEELFKDYSEEIVQQILLHHQENGGISRYDKIRYYFKEIIKEEINDVTYQKYILEFHNLVLEKVKNSNFIKGSIEFLNNNMEDFNYFLVSATPKKELDEILTFKSLDSYFIKTYGSPTTKRDNLKYLLSENNLSHSEVIYIGDSINDFAACIENKILFIGIS